MAVTSDAPRMPRRDSPARRRILDTAGRLFYAEGVRAVGVDRIIATAGVAKATFYSHFPAKDDLVRDYLTEHSRLQRAAALGVRASEQTPREMILTLFDAIGEAGCGPGFRGCPFVNAAVEYPDPGHPVRRVIAEHRAWFRDLLRDLLDAAALPEAEQTAAMLILVRDGLVVGSQLDDAAEVRGLVRAAVTGVLDRADLLPGRRPTR
jgi:AcrR family transcriptional regulator